MSSKLSDIGFRILTTSDFLFGLLSQLQLLILEGFCSTGDLLLNHPMPGLIFAFPRLNRTFLQKIQRCSVCPEMSNKIALVSLDFAGTGSMCGGNKGVGGHGCALSKNNNQDLFNRNSQPARQGRGNRTRSGRLALAPGFTRRASKSHSTWSNCCMRPQRCSMQRA